MTPTVTEVVLDDLRAEIARKRMNQREVAELVGEDPVWLSRRLRGETRLTLDDFHRIASAIGCSPVVRVDGVPDHVKSLQAERFGVHTR